MAKFDMLTQGKCKQGFSLIEVLVALVILVIGLIGIFNLHIVAKRASFESYQQTQASYYANDIINRMKLNPTQLATYVGKYTGSPSADDLEKSCENSAFCNTEELQKWDIYEWQSAFTGAAEISDSKNVGGLDSPTACIEVTNREVLVVIVWRGISKTSIDTAAVEDVSGNCAKDTENRRVFSLKTVIK